MEEPPTSSRLYAATRKAPTATNASNHERPRERGATPIAPAPARPTARGARAARPGMRVPSGRPFSSSSACAATPSASANATSAQASRASANGRERRADRDVAQVPRRVRRVQQRQVVAPAAGLERVERRTPARAGGAVPRVRRHDRPTPPSEAQARRRRRPRRRRRRRTARSPAARSSGRERRWKVADARAEEAADLVPARRDDAARAGSPTRTYSSQSGRRAARQPELERWRSSRRAGRRARARASVGGRVLDVAEQVRERERVERARRRTAAPRRSPRRASAAGAAAASARRREHLGALVQPDDAAARPAGELERDRGGARRDVEHARRPGGVDARDEEPPPARVLAEGEQGA